MPVMEEDECSLLMECIDEPLTPVQKKYRSQTNSICLAQLEELKKLVSNGSSSSSLNIDSDGTATFTSIESCPSIIKPQTTNTPTPISTSSYRLIMDPRTGKIVGNIANTGNPSPPISLPTTPILTSSSSSSSSPQSVKVITRTPPVLPTIPLPKISSKPITSPLTPQIVDLTRPSISSSEKSSKPSIPALLVIPRPSKTISNLSVKRSELDSKVKNLLVQSPAKFTEFLIQQGLVPIEQIDYPDGNPLKLCMHSDTKKFPYTGGYVWMSETNSSKLVSVLRGSLFAASNHSPTVILKLIYHWSCQTNIQNVVLWVKVDNGVINHYFRLFRSICTKAVHNAVANLGGGGKSVQIGVISLGTTTGEGSKREVRVEVLGVLDTETGKIRLRATEPAHGVSQSDRFARIFEPLPIWVVKTARIVTDFSVDRERLIKLGYTNVVQCNSVGKKIDASNFTVMDYLKKTVPKMFQNNLSFLSTTQIQQFLDELSFREINNYPLAAFQSMLKKIAAITRSLSNQKDGVVAHLRKVQDNPFNDWRTPISKNTPVSIPSFKDTPRVFPTAKRPASDFNNEIDTTITKKLKIATDLVNLESYFYGTIPGDVEVLSSEFKADMAFKCHLCKKVFMNNIEFMKHLCLHIEKDRASSADLADLCQCKYCFKDFDTPYAMQTHFEVSHLKKGCEFVCKICDEGFNVKNQLIHHMTKNHIASELPYNCNSCGYRSSDHCDLIDHFYEAHDRTDKLMCPRCLKIFSLNCDKGYNSNVAVSFISHLQDHRYSKNHNCKSCRLTFTNSENLRAHLNKSHASFKTFDNLVPYAYTSNEDPIKCPKPNESTARLAARKSGLVKTTTQNAFAAQNLDDVAFYDVDKLNCGECSKKMTSFGHFAAYLCCTKCRYSTCCSKAITTHVSNFHSQSSVSYDLGLPVIMENDMFCVCGFRTNSGNKMAKHLGSHNCKSAYPSEEAAKDAIRSSASFAPLISIDKEDPSLAMGEAYRKSISKNEQNTSLNNETESKSNPLAFLGLKPTEKEASPKSDEDCSPNSEESKKSPTQELNKIVD